MIARKKFSQCWAAGQQAILAGTLLLGFCRSSLAQIVPDNTLGSESSTVAPDMNIQGVSRGSSAVTEGIRIEGGAIRGTTLFHSFEQFNVNEGRGAYFANPSGIENILSRVTGANRSDILGRLGVLGNANLFLINPNGIVFGPAASLDVQGSFLATTANAVKLGHAGLFSASQPMTSNLLSVSPSALWFNAVAASPIRVEGVGSNISVQVPAVSPLIRGNSFSGLKVTPGKTLALVGGAVDIEGGTLIAEQGRIELGSVRAGQVSLSFVPQGLALSYQNAQDFQDIQLSQQALVDASEGSSIQVQGNQVSLTNGSLLLNRNQGAQGGGEILVNAAQSVNLSGLSFDGRFASSLSSQTTGTGDGANIAVSARQVVGQSGGLVTTRSYGSGRTGNITVNASDSVTFAGSIPAPGSLPINPIFSSGILTTPFNAGDGGTINLSTRRLSVLASATVSSVTLGRGQGGAVTVTATEAIEIAGQSSPLLTPSSLSSTTFSAGDAGAMTVNTARLTLRDGGNVSSTTVGFGNAGALTINATDSIELSGVVPNSPTPTALEASAPMVSEEFRQALQLPARPSGNSGNLTVTTSRLEVKDGAAIRVSNGGTGSAGTVKINANWLDLDGGTITAATASGEGGNIDLTVRDDLRLRRASQITTSAQGTGNGGNIVLKASSILAFGDSDILAFSRNGRGGNITLNTRAFLGENYRPAPRGTDASTLNGNTRVDVNATGTIASGTIVLPDTSFIQNSLTELPENQIDTNTLLASSCIVRRNQPIQGRFTITGTGGFPQRPGDTQMSNFPTVSVETLPNPKPTSNRGWQKGDAIVEPQGVYRLPNGKLVLSRNCL